MFRGDWDADFAFVGTIIVILNLAGWALIASDPTGKQYDSYSAHRCAEQKAQHSARLSIGNIEQSSTSEKSTQQAGSEKQQDPDWCDLAAQESMAKSTVGMERSAWATTILTFCGLLLLGMTVHYTKRAAQAADSTLREAEKTTAAAAEMNSITRKGYQDEHRAWIRVDGIKVAVEGAGDKTEGFRVDLRLKTSIRNAGRTPATDVNVNITFAEMPKTIDETIYSPAINGGVQPAFKVALMPDDVCHKPQEYFIDNAILASKFVIIVLINYTAYPGAQPCTTGNIFTFDANVRPMQDQADKLSWPVLMT